MPATARVAQSILRALVGAAMAVVSVACLLYLGLLLLHYQPLVIVTGSMQKTIPVGSLVVDRSVDPATLRVGDVITFEKPLGEKGLDTHRIVAIRDAHGTRLFRTKGDSNPVADPWIIRFDRGMRAHRMVFSLPHAGNALLLVRAPAGRIALLALVSLLVLRSLLGAIASSAQSKAARAAQ
jgi:signal peptidase